MLFKAATLKGYKLNSLEGEIGKVKEFYFDDRYWTVRYLVAETGTWLTGRQVLISPFALAAVNSEDQNIAINLTRQQIEDSPALDTDKPVSHQFEEAFHEYYGLSLYWKGPYRWGFDPYILNNENESGESAAVEGTWDRHLFSTDDVIGHQVQASDHDIGHIEDFIVDDKTWAIRYLVINTRNWLAGKKVIVSPLWIEQISWSEAKVLINLSSEMIRQSPEYIDSMTLNRDYETKLHQHYNREGYWSEEPDDREQK